MEYEVSDAVALPLVQIRCGPQPGEVVVEPAPEAEVAVRQGAVPVAQVGRLDAQGDVVVQEGVDGHTFAVRVQREQRSAVQKHEHVLNLVLAEVPRAPEL